MKQDKHRSAVAIALIAVLFCVYSVGTSAGELFESSVAPTAELSLPDLSARQRNLEEFAGRVLLVNFWASWCMPCIEEMPSMQRLTRAMQDKPFVVIGVNVGETQRRVQATVKRLGIDFTILLDKNSAVFKEWGATVLPTTYVLDRSGRVRYIGQGPLEWDRVDMVELLGELVEQ